MTMAEGKRGFFRDNLVLVAAFALPAVVAVLFIVATAIPKWTVPLPQHDLVLRDEDYRQTRQADVVAVQRYPVRRTDAVAAIPCCSRRTSEPVEGADARHRLLGVHRPAAVQRQPPTRNPVNEPDGDDAER